ncbi:MAG: hypothetical protein ACUVTG_08990 [Candidatus Oleimicrobiaceae bacterium]
MRRSGAGFDPCCGKNPAGAGSRGADKVDQNPAGTRNLRLPQREATDGLATELSHLGALRGLPKKKAWWLRAEDSHPAPVVPGQRGK